MLFDLFIGTLTSFCIALFAYYKHSLTFDGLITATCLGAAIYLFGGFTVWAVLIAFFISSSLLTKLHEKKDKESSQGRNYVQVISNGLVAVVFSALYYLTQTDVFLLAAVVSIASSNSDTWASEIGALSKGKTIHIINFKQVPKGVSGAISRLGTFASLLGALFIALVFVAITALSREVTLPLLFQYGLIITVCGFIGCLVDSFLGASLQAKYRGITTGLISEKRWLPNEKVVLASGLAFITNDAVNFLSGLAASLFTLVFFM